jgi:hypothetical protein
VTAPFPASCRAGWFDESAVANSLPNSPPQPRTEGPFASSLAGDDVARYEGEGGRASSNAIPKPTFCGHGDDPTQAAPAHPVKGTVHIKMRPVDHPDDMPDGLFVSKGKPGPSGSQTRTEEPPAGFRPLDQNEVVSQGDYVMNDRHEVELWEGPGGFHADSFVKQVYRRVSVVQQSK